MKLFLALIPTVLAAKAAAAPEPAKNAAVEYFMDIFNAVFGASLGAAQDALDLVVGFPPYAASTFVWAVDFARSFPGLCAKVASGDDATLKDLTGFCTYVAGTIFVVHASVLAANLMVNLISSVRDYFKGYMDIPKSIAGQKIPAPISDVLGVVQKQVLDRIKNFKVSGTIIPLDGQSGSVTLASAAKSMAATTSACMILSCAPAVHDLMRDGANKAAAEALLYTMGTALGVQYLVQKV